MLAADTRREAGWTTSRGPRRMPCPRQTDARGASAPGVLRFPGGAVGIATIACVAHGRPAVSGVCVGPEQTPPLAWGGMNRRSPSAVQVPVLVGLSVDEAHDAALDAGLLAVNHSESDPAATAGQQASSPPRRVYRQEPPTATVMATGTRVGMWVRRPDDPGSDDDDGGGPDLAPTGPGPQSGTGTK